MLKTAKVVGLNSDQKAALALICSNNTALFLIISCEVDDAFSRTKQAMVAAEDSFFSSDKPLSERLTEAFSEVEKSLEDSQNLQIILASTFTENGEQGKKVLYLLSKGNELLGILLRNGKKTDLCKVSNGELVSGFLESGDRLVMATVSLKEVLAGSFDTIFELPLENIEDEVNLRLPEAEVAPLAVIIVEEEGIVLENDEDLKKDLEQPKVKVELNFNRTIFRSKKIAAISVSLLIIILLIFGGVFLKFKGGITKEASLGVNNLENQIITPTDTLKIYRISDFPLWLDLDLIKKGFLGEKFSLSLGKLAILDKNQKVAVSIDSLLKSQQILAGPDKLGEALELSINGSVVWVYSKDLGILKIEEGKVSSAIKKDDEWGEIVDLYGFAGNVYLLDRGKGQIWKYLPIVDGYSDAREYFAEGVKVNLVDAVKLQIDSSVWILKRGGEILKFTAGNPDFFSLNGLDRPLKEVSSFFVSDKTESLYILDKGNNRLLVLDKKGNYQAQYQGDKFKEVIDLVVDETNKKAYLLGGGKIYLLELK